MNWDCVCNYFANQASQISNVLEVLSNQSVTSDINLTSSDGLTISETGLAISPMNMFVLFLVSMWTIMFLAGDRRQRDMPEKPRPNSGNGHDDGLL